MSKNNWRASGYPAGSVGRWRTVSLLVVGLLGAGALTALLVSMRHGQQISRQALQPEATMEDTIAALRRVDPALILYQPVAQVETGLRHPRGIAVGPAGRLFVAGDEVVRIFTGDGRLVEQINLPEPPHCLAVSPAGDLYIGFRSHVSVYSTDGRLLAHWGTLGPKSYLTSIAVAGPDVFVGVAGEREVLHYNRADGQLLGRIAGRDPAKKQPGLLIPSPHLDVAVRRDGLLWVTDPGRLRVELYDREGHLKSYWGKPGNAIDHFCGCCNPTDLALLPDGRVVTSEKGLPRVKLYSPAGKFLGVVAPPDALSTYAVGLDLAVDHQGRVLVLDPQARMVRIFAPRAAAVGQPAKQGVKHE